MQLVRRLGLGLAAAACLAWLAPPAVVAEEPAKRSPIHDVELGKGGSLRGLVVDANGKPSPGAEVRLLHAASKPMKTAANEQGWFAIPGVHGGAYKIESGDGAVLVRAWAPGTAPPAAGDAVLVVRGPTLRGQLHPTAFALGDHWVLAGIATAAILVPVIIRANRDHRPDGS